MASTEQLKATLKKKLNDRAKLAFDETFPPAQLSGLQQKMSKAFAKKLSEYADDEIDIIIETVLSRIIAIPEALVAGTVPVTGTIKLIIKPA